VEDHLYALLPLLRRQREGLGPRVDRRLGVGVREGVLARRRAAGDLEIGLCVPLRQVVADKELAEGLSERADVDPVEANFPQAPTQALYVVVGPEKPPVLGPEHLVDPVPEHEPPVVGGDGHVVLVDEGTVEVDRHEAAGIWMGKQRPGGASRAGIASSNEGGRPRIR
jgi:hypothetical protein